MEKESSIQMSAAQFEQMMVRLAAELRKPPVDPIKEAQKAREQKSKDEGNAAMWRNRAEKRKLCAHSRQDGTCVIAWAEQSDKAWRGYCPNCQSIFAPGDPDYAEQRSRPRGLMENVRVVS